MVATTWALPLLEVLSLLLLFWCLADAARRGCRPVLELLAGALVGLIAEQLAIAAGAGGGWPVTYRYGGFHWWVTPDVPLAIVAAWGALLYAAVKYSDSLAIPRWMRPAADGLYALLLDLAMELVAVRLGLWRWAIPAESQWFGIPWSNFGGWLLLAVLFSASLRGLRSLRRNWAYAAGLLALVALLPPLTIRLLGILFTGTEQDLWPVGSLALLAAAILVSGLIWRRYAPGAALQDALADAPPPAGWLDPSLGLPVIWHMAYLGIGVASGALTPSAPLFITGTVAVAGTLLVLGLVPVRPKL